MKHLFTFLLCFSLFARVGHWLDKKIGIIGYAAVERWNPAIQDYEVIESSDKPVEHPIFIGGPRNEVKTESLYDRADDLGKEWDRELNNRDEAMRTGKLEKD